MAEEDLRPELPGSGGPPVEGPLWVRIKLGVWGLVLVLILGAAFVVAGILSAGG